MILAWESTLRTFLTLFVVQRLHRIEIVVCFYRTRSKVGKRIEQTPVNQFVINSYVIHVGEYPLTTSMHVEGGFIRQETECAKLLLVGKDYQLIK